MIDVGIPRHQRGWAGIILLLVVLLVIAMVAQTMLRQYFASAQATSANASLQKRGSLATDTVPGAPADASTASPAPANAVERARGVEATVQRQADDATKRIDEETR